MKKGREPLIFYHHPKFLPLCTIIIKQVKMCMNHQKVRIPATISASRSLPTFSPNDFAQIRQALFVEPTIRIRLIVRHDPAETFLVFLLSLSPSYLMLSYSR